ncbi:response regulator [Paenibacillus roseipurpureus]|uniref:Response regulator n=1 Tax=Paenibacillus roseopurpureus TaxID=2918901 RepID=A0AA96LUN4_9BACL|nr:response regulator [Paenibacillus sp. MBLB1832]WNR46811.1 response regulator [Paenibacillus sp. MBLB1832]
MTFRVLLVDDEMIDLNYLQRTVPWDDLGMTLVGTANSAFNALKILEKESIDILVSDIRMPIMSGLELARKAKQIQPKLSVVFVSGHEEFEYAKQAIIIQAFGYVLKPVDDLELHQMLRSLAAKLMQERLGEQEKQIVEKALPIIKHEVLHQWLEGTLPEGEGADLLQLHKELKDEGEVIVVVIELDDAQWKLAAMDVDEREQRLEQFHDFMQKNLLFTPSNGIAFRSSPYRYVGLFKGRQSEVWSRLASLVERVRVETHFTITIGFGNEASTAKQWIVSYEQAKKALDQKMFEGKSRIIVYDPQGELGFEQQLGQVNRKLDAIFDCLQSYNLVGIDDCLEDMFRQVKSLGTRLSVYNFVMYVLTRLEDMNNNKSGEQHELWELPFGKLDELYRLETTEDIKSWLRRKLFELSEKMMIKSRSQDRIIIHKVREYVLEHLNGKITLKDVANRFAFSPNYLGFLFKEETGETFSDFLIRTRMEAARGMLMDPSIKIYEITHRVGYKNIIYFSRQFKDYVGLTPSEFRKKQKV